MARSIRIQIAGGFYHVMARGNRREKIFADDDDRRFFLSTLSEACGMTGWRVHAWVLMGNHYHLFIETPEANLVEGMKWLQNAYTRRFNVRHRKWGRLFGDRYKAVIVEDSRSDYYRTLMDYIHLNPVRARIIEPRRGESVMDYPWSSVAGGYALPPGRRAKWLAAEHALGVFECGDTAAGRRRFVERLDRRAVEEEAKRCGVPALGAEFDARCSHLRKGWYWGTQAFAERLLRGLGKKVAGFKGADLPECAREAFPRPGGGGKMSGQGTHRRGSGPGGPQATTRQRRSQGGTGVVALWNDDGLADMDCGRA